MNELTEQAAGTQPGTKRAPVIWRIASVTDERQSVTVVFPVDPDRIAEPAVTADVQPE